jgi:ankyrin repeat protein
MPMKKMTMARKRIKWAILIALPVALFLIILPIVRKRQQQAATEALIQATRERNSVDVMQQLISRGADVNARYKSPDPFESGNTPLHFSAGRGTQVSTVQILLDNGANIDARNDMGQTPLMLAAQYGFTDIIQLLLDKDAKVNLRAKPGGYLNGTNKARTALNYAQERLAIAHKQNQRQVGGERAFEPQLRESVKILKAAGAEE